MKALPLDDQRLVNAADGWLGLRDPRSAREELDQIASESREHPAVLLCAIRVHSYVHEWENCIEVASRLVNVATDCAEGWVHRSYALHELKRTQEAFDLLQPAADKFPANWVVPYNLACYTCQLGHNNDACEWLKRAISLDRGVKRAATGDPDLKPLWEKMRAAGKTI
jgi:hypothetical protein